MSPRARYRSSSPIEPRGHNRRRNNKRSRSPYYYRRKSHSRSRSRSRSPSPRRTRYPDRRPRHSVSYRKVREYGVSTRQLERFGKPVLPASCEAVDENLVPVEDDPRRQGSLDLKGLTLKGGGRNTESFDPRSTLVRPEMRVRFGRNDTETYDKPMKHDDVIVVPDFFCKEDDTSMYYKLVQELRDIQKADDDKQKKAEWIPWHEGCHLITKNPTESPSFKAILAKVSQYFGLREGSQGIRFNWYRDSSDWKPFHHDSAAFNHQRAKSQNVTVGISFGAERELAFLHADNKTKVYFPQTNGMMFAFGKDVNITWKHGVNALPKDEQHGKGRISIIVWGWCPKVIDEPNSPPMLTNDRRQTYDTRRGKEPCRDFAKGKCTYGSRCRFAHIK